MLDTLTRVAKNPLVNVLIAVAFLIFAVLGYHFGGTPFLTQWVGGVAAAISITALIFKTQGYWAWSIVNAILWFFLYKNGLPMLAGLQVSFFLFSLYGFWQWASVKWRIGYDRNVWTDNLGTLISLGIFVYTVIAYLGLSGYAFTGWWYIELIGVFISIIANWMDAFKYKTNWIGWTMTNLLFGPLFFHGHLWGPFVLTFLYQALCVVGIVNWYRDERKLVASGKVERVGGAQIA